MNRDAPRRPPLTSTATRRRYAAYALVAAASWPAMMAIHELGHVLGGWMTGGRVVEVNLHLLAFTSTHVNRNPHPRIVAWMGPIIGCLLPLLAWLAWRTRPGAGLLRWFAGFCLIANGAYLGVGWIDRVGDAGDLLHHGAHPWTLITFAALTLPLGLTLWRRPRPQRPPSSATA